MYCPKCGTQNIDNASFCRGCGTNLSLVPQALTGHLPPQPAHANEPWDESLRARRRRKRNEPPSIERAVTNICVGIGFLLAALWVLFEFPGGIFWGWAFFFPAFGSLGKGLGDLFRLRQERQAAQLAPHAYTPPPIGPAQQGELPPRATSEIYPPASVTEHTTRLLDRDK